MGPRSGHGLLSGLRGALAEFGREWASRRAGRRHAPGDIRQHARDVAGLTGFLYSRGWDHVARTTPSYLRSFERSPRVPPSLHVSARDRRRQGSVVPLAERCVEDHAKPPDERPGPWSIAELASPPPRARRRRH